MATLSGCLRSFLSKSNALHRVVGFSRLLPLSYIHTSRLLFDAAGQTIKMPSLSPTMTEGTIVRWLKKEGDTISPGDVLCEIQTDKAIVGFEVEDEGILAKILVPDDSKDVKIGTVIGIMVDVGEDWKSAKIIDADNGESAPKTEAVEGMAQGIEIKMPSLSPTMTEGTIVKWLKQEGEKFEPGDALCEIQTDKAVVAFEVEEEGILAKIIVPENTKDVKLGTVIALMVNEGEDWKNVSVPAAPSSKAAPAKAVSPEKAPATKVADSSEQLKLCGPSARLLLQEYGIKHSIITPSGPHNALLKGDVLSYITQNKLKPKVDMPEVIVPAVPDITFIEKQNYIDIPHTSMRQIIARRLTESKTTICHAYMGIDCMVDEVTKLRAQMKNEGVSVSVNDFVIKCVAGALRKVPEVNVVRVKDTAKVCDSVDISVAVATDKGLITPIVKGADTLGIQQISECVKALAAKAREGRLRPEEFQGGSFSISNLGMFGISEFTAVINPPQGAILAVGTSRPVFRNKSPATKMTVTLSFDNCLISETSAAKFLQYFKNLIENPVMMMVSADTKH